MRAIVLSLILSSVSGAAFAEKYTLGVVPQQSPLKMFKAWKPIADHLSKATGHEIVFKTERSIAEFEKVLYRGGYDIAYVNPYHFVVAHRTQNYQAVVRDSKVIRGVLVANNSNQDFESLIKSEETRFLFPSPNAFAATLLTKFELLSKYGVNINLDRTQQYVNSHDSVYSGIARGTGDLGGGIERTYNNFSNDADKGKLKIIYTTSSYPSHPIVLKPDLDSVTQDKLTKALLDLPNALTDKLSMVKLIPSNNEEFQPIAALEASLSTVERN